MAIWEEKTGVSWWIISPAMWLWVSEITNMTNRIAKENRKKEKKLWLHLILLKDFLNT